MGKGSHVKLDLAHTLFEIVLGEQTILSEPSVVYQDVDHDLRASGLVENVGGGSGLGQVGGQNQRTGAMQLLYFGRQLAKSVNAARDQHEVVAFAGKDAGEFQANAGGSAGDESGFAIRHVGQLRAASHEPRASSNNKIP